MALPSQDKIRDPNVISSLPKNYRQCYLGRKPAHLPALCLKAPREQQRLSQKTKDQNSQRQTGPVLPKPTPATLLSSAPAQPCPARAAQSFAGPPQPKALVRKHGAFRNTRRESDLSSPGRFSGGGRAGGCGAAPARALPPGRPRSPPGEEALARVPQKTRHRGVTPSSGGESQRGTPRDTHPTPDRIRNHERDGGPRALHLQPRRDRLK